MVVLVSQAGCVTRNLWEETYFAPVIPAGIRLYESVSPPGVIVEYDERIAGGRRTGRRAYFLSTDASPDANRAPVFVTPPGGIQGLRSISIVDVHEQEFVASATGYSATTFLNANQFVLYREGECLGTFEPPSYWKRKGTVGRAVLLPFAVAADAVASAAIVGGVAVDAAASGYVGSGGGP